MFPGMNSRKAAQIMKKMGIQQVEIPATEVIIKTPEKEIIITEPQVSKVNMMGKDTFQIMGNINEREPEDEAKKAISDSEGDLAKAILSLKKD